MLFISALCYSQSNEEFFKKGNDFYNKGEYENALTEYQKIKNTENAVVYFNMANAYYKMNKVAPAIYFYEKALLINPAYEDAQNNLLFAKRMTVDVIEPLPESFFEKLSEKTIHHFSYGTWGVISVVFSFLFVGFFLMYYFLSSSVGKLWSFNFAIFSFVGLLFSFVVAYTDYQSVQNDNPAIIFSPTVAVKNAPTDSGDAIFELHEGTKVQLLDGLENWKKIQIANGKEGWVKAESIKALKTK